MNPCRHRSGAPVEAAEGALRVLSCAIMQGSRYGKPMPLAGFKSWPVGITRVPVVELPAQGAPENLADTTVLGNC